MKFKKMFLPILILTIGVIAIVITNIMCSIAKKPTIEEKEFPYSVTYKLNGKTEKLEGVYKCNFIKDNAEYPLDRYYEGVFVGREDEQTITYTLEKKKGETLVLFTEFYADYLMGDSTGDYYDDDQPYKPFLAVYDEEGIEYTDKETLSHFDVEIIGWEFPTPIENTLVFSHITRITTNSIFPMAFAAILTILACVILVRKDKDVQYQSLDSISVVFNFLIGFVAIPFSALFAALTDIYSTGEELVYQICFCVPAFMALCVAISICLRRKGYSKAGLIVQFAGPVLFVLTLIAEIIF